MSDFKVGDTVIYTPKHLIGQPVPADNYGVVTSLNDWYVFVRYGDHQGSKAARSKDLEHCPEQPDD